MDGGSSFYTENIIRISLINEQGNIVLDTLVKPLVKVSQSRSFIHGIEMHEYEKAPEFQVIQSLIKKLS